MKKISSKLLFLGILITQSGFLNYYQDPVLEARKIIEKRSIANTTKEELQKKAIQGMTKDLDDYSEFLDTKDLEMLQESISGEFVGVGMEVYKKPSDKFVKIIAPIADSPAQKAGLKAGDKIFEVEGHPVADKNIIEVVNLIKGKEGTDVKLKVEQDLKIKNITLTRKKIKTQSVTIEKHDDVFVIVVRSFMQNTFDEFKRALEQYYTDISKYNYLVIDLRNNPGGLLDVVVNMSNLFLEKGQKIVTIKVKNDKIIGEYKSNNLNPIKVENLFILINKGSASASEIFAAALKENNKATLVGETTFGKGSVQEVVPMSTLKDTAIKLTIARYYTPNGNSVDKIGVSPDKKINIKNYTEIKNIQK